MNTQTTTRRNESDETTRRQAQSLRRLKKAIHRLESAVEAEPETWHSRFMGRVDRATSWTWGRGIVIALAALLVFSGGMHLILTALTGGN